MDKVMECISEVNGNIMTRYSPAEMMIVAASREIKDGETVLVGVGIPNLAVNLAKRTHAPKMRMIYESGTIGSQPSRPPLSIGDPCLASGAQAIIPMFEGFAFYLQNGLIDVGFLGGAQIDRFGNINSTVIGDYKKPKVRLPGSGGACEIALWAKRTIIISPHEKRRFPEKVDFITSPGYLPEATFIRGGKPAAVITDLGILRFDESGEMMLYSLHPGVELQKVAEQTGWALKVSSELQTTEEPTNEELRILREELDPDGIYISPGGQ